MFGVGQALANVAMNAVEQGVLYLATAVLNALVSIGFLTPEQLFYNQGWNQCISVSGKCTATAANTTSFGGVTLLGTNSPSASSGPGANYAWYGLVSQGAYDHVLSVIINGMMGVAFLLSVIPFIISGYQFLLSSANPKARISFANMVQNWVFGGFLISMYPIITAIILAGNMQICSFFFDWFVKSAPLDPNNIMNISMGKSPSLALVIATIIIQFVYLGLVIQFNIQFIVRRVLVIVLLLVGPLLGGYPLLFGGAANKIAGQFWREFTLNVYMQAMAGFFYGVFVQIQSYSLSQTYTLSNAWLAIGFLMTLLPFTQILRMLLGQSYGSARFTSMIGGDMMRGMMGVVGAAGATLGGFGGALMGSEAGRLGGLSGVAGALSGIAGGGGSGGDPGGGPGGGGGSRIMGQRGIAMARGIGGAVASGIFGGATALAAHSMAMGAGAGHEIAAGISRKGFSGFKNAGAGIAGTGAALGGIAHGYAQQRYWDKRNANNADQDNAGSAGSSTNGSLPTFTGGAPDATGSDSDNVMSMPSAMNSIPDLQAADSGDSGATQDQPLGALARAFGASDQTHFKHEEAGFLAGAIGQQIGYGLGGDIGASIGGQAGSAITRGIQTASGRISHAGASWSGASGNVASRGYAAVKGAIFGAPPSANGGSIPPEVATRLANTLNPGSRITMTHTPRGTAVAVDGRLAFKNNYVHPQTRNGQNVTSSYVVSAPRQMDVPTGTLDQRGNPVMRQVPDQSSINFSVGGKDLSIRPTDAQVVAPSTTVPSSFNASMWMQ